MTALVLHIGLESSKAVASQVEVVLNLAGKGREAHGHVDSANLDWESAWAGRARRGLRAELHRRRAVRSARATDELGSDS